MLLGHVTETEIEIVKSVPIKHVSTLTSDDQPSCDYKAEDLEIIKLKAEKEGLEWIGSVHSHPGWTVNSPSESDNDSARDNHEQVFGIYNLERTPRVVISIAASSAFTFRRSLWPIPHLEGVL